MHYGHYASQMHSREHPLPDSFALIYAPGVNQIQSLDLVKKIKAIAERMDLTETEICINPDPQVDNQWKNHPDKLKALIIGWGLPEEPSWGLLFDNFVSLETTHDIYAIDLFARKGADGRTLEAPRVNAGKYWSRRVQEKNLRLFFKGYYIKNSVPYGMKRVPVTEIDRNVCSSRKRLILKPGEPSEIEIVKLIFDLFVNHDYNRTKISNLLNAQKVAAPNRSDLWNAGKVLNILKSPMYIGANQYRGAIIHNVFAPLIDESVYYEAQARIYLFQKYSNYKLTGQKAFH